MRPGSGRLVDHHRSGRFGRCKEKGSREPDRGRAQAAIGNDVLDGLVRVVLRHGPVIVMVMRLVLPVQDGVGHFFYICKRGGLPADGDGLPERRK